MHDLNFETEIKFVQQVLIAVVRDSLIMIVIKLYDKTIKLCISTFKYMFLI